MEEEKDVLQDTQKPDKATTEAEEQIGDSEELDELFEEGVDEIEETQDNQPDPKELEEKNKQLFSRAKKAEKELKELKARLKELETKKADETKEKPSIDLDEIDKRIFLANGGDKEDLEILETIKKGKGISLAEAQQDELYKLYLAKKEAEKKRREAQLGASKAGVAAKKQKQLSPEEEKREVMKRASEILKKNFG